MKCPDCGLTIEDKVPLNDHRGDVVCVAWQARAKATSLLKRAGSTWKTQQHGGIKFTWVVMGLQELERMQDPIVTYARMAPAWAVDIAECTDIEPAERSLVIAHCLAHPAAQRATSAAFRLGGVKTGPAKGKSLAAQRDFFKGVLLTVGP